MNKHTPPPLSGQILDDATTWFVEFNEGEVTHAARQEFIQWLRTSPEHVRAYLQVTAHWEDARSLRNASTPSIDELVAVAQDPPNANVIPIGASRPSEAPKSQAPIERLSPDTQSQRRRLRRFSLAAGLATLTVGAGALYWSEFQRGVYSTDIGEQRSIRLEDGSTVELNARSKIRVSLHVSERDVELIQGQALFRVAKDHARPFIVHSGETNVLAVGTEFDVYKRHSGDTTVTVVEGKVAVYPSALPPSEHTTDPTLPAHSQQLAGTPPQESSHYLARNKTAASAQGSAAVVGLPSGPHPAALNQEIFLAAGEQLTVSNASLDKPAHPDVAAATAWIQKQIIFNNTPLSEVVDEFNRYNTRQLVITDPSIADTKISGEFSSTNPDSLLKGLDGLKKFNIRDTSARIEISGQ